VRTYALRRLLQFVPTRPALTSYDGITFMKVWLAP